MTLVTQWGLSKKLRPKTQSLVGLLDLVSSKLTFGPKIQQFDILGLFQLNIPGPKFSVQRQSTSPF